MCDEQTFLSCVALQYDEPNCSEKFLKWGHTLASESPLYSLKLFEALFLSVMQLFHLMALFSRFTFVLLSAEDAWLAEFNTFFFFHQESGQFTKVSDVFYVNKNYSFILTTFLLVSLFFLMTLFTLDFKMHHGLSDEWTNHRLQGVLQTTCVYCRFHCCFFTLANIRHTVIHQHASTLPLGGHAVWPLSPKQPHFPLTSLLVTLHDAWVSTKCMWWSARTSGVIDPITVWLLQSGRPRHIFKNKCRRGLCHSLYQLILIWICLSVVSVCTWLSVCLHACLPLCLRLPKNWFSNICCSVFFIVCPFLYEWTT